MKKRLLPFLLLMIARSAFAEQPIYLQATGLLAATNFDYVSTSYTNGAIEGFYNFKDSIFIVGGGLGELSGTTDDFYADAGGVYNSHFTAPYVSLFGGVMLHPTYPKITNITTIRIAQSFSANSQCNASAGYACHPTHSAIHLIQLGARNSTLYFFTPQFYGAFNLGMDINQFIFSPSFSINPDTQIPSRTYHNPGPNLGFSVGVRF